jgi:hypothetical protein
MARAKQLGRWLTPQGVLKPQELYVFECHNINTAFALLDSIAFDKTNCKLFDLAHRPTALRLQQWRFG